VSEVAIVRRDADAAGLARLREAAGAAALLGDEELPRFAVAGVVPRAVVAPDSVEAVARTLALCSAQGWPVEPAGAATWLVAGAPPGTPPVVISTARIGAIREYEPADLVVGVEAGMPLDALAGELATQRQSIPLDPPAAPGATIGAAIALASAGPLRAAHGTPRDMVLGVEAIAGDGRVLRFGGRVVKNVAGYDLVRLLVGSRGAFALLTSLFIRLRSVPDVDSTTIVAADDLTDAVALAAEIRRRMSPDALEVIGPGLAAQVLPPGAAAARWTVLVRLRGTDAAVGEMTERLGRITGSSAEKPGPDVAPAIWQAAGMSEAGAPLCFRVADLPSRLSQSAAAVLRITDAVSAAGAAGEVLDWRVAIHAADGIVRAWPAALPWEDALARLASDLSALAAELANAGATVSWPVWPAFAEAARVALTDSGAARQRLLTELKARFDPAGILSPSRHVAGL
jgi:glycolate oxidase FAD binding subunit